MKLGRLQDGRIRGSLRWTGLGLLLALVVGSVLIAGGFGFKVSTKLYLVAATLTAMGVIGFAVSARLTRVPPQLRTLRVLAILLPTLFVAGVQTTHVETDGLFTQLTELGEHVMVTAVLSLSTIPFSIWIFRSFTRLRDKLAFQTERLERLHRASLAVTGESAAPRLHDAILHGARAVVSADRAVLLVSSAIGGPDLLVADPPSPAPGDRELALLKGIASSPTCLIARVRGPQSHALLVGRADGPEFSSEEALVLDMFAVAAAAGIENALRLEEAQRLATIEERERIAHDLHDDLGQLLGFLTTKIQAARELVSTNRSALAAEELTDLERATRALSEQVREAILGLRTSAQLDRSLARSIEGYTAEFGIHSDLRTTFDQTPGAGESLQAPARYHLLRIVQEAMSNVRRHAAATMIVVTLREHDGMLELSVCDDGTGFDARVEAGTGHFGLKTMAERARAVGGTLVVRSAPGAGTTVCATVPASRSGAG